MIKMIALILFSFIVESTCRNLEVNNIIPIDIDISKRLPDQVKVRYIHHLRCNVYEVDETDVAHVRIGNVYEYGILVYPDSDILVKRRVFKLISESYNFSIIQVNSTYRKGEVEQKEMTELLRHPNENFFREVVRKAFELNLRPGYINRPEIKVIYDTSTRVTKYGIRPEDRLRYKIGAVKYGDIMIDGYHNTVTSKLVETHIDEKGNLVVEVMKMLKNGDSVNTKCMMVFKDPPEKSLCKDLEITIRNLVV